MFSTYLIASLLVSVCALAVFNVNETRLTAWEDVRAGLKGLGYNTTIPTFMPWLEGTNYTSYSCAATCIVLRGIAGYAVSLESEEASVQQNLYWSSIQTEVQPECRIEPGDATEIAAFILLTKFFKCPFAVKSGGHAAFAGASNIQGGLTVDLRRLNQVQVTNNRTLTQVGAGNTWFDVYSKLDPMELSVVGGRVAAIGVGGLTLGGGISFFSGRHGWALDGVRNYQASSQVVLANSQIINVNQTSYPDLYFALRGGGNNFGIVTRFDLETFPQGLLWGGMRNYPLSAAASIFTAFTNFAHNSSSDPDAALITACALFNGSFSYNADFEYANPVPDPPIFHEFTSIPYLASTTRIASLSNLTLELNASNPSGFRETYTTATFHLSPILQTRILDIFTTAFSPLKHIPGILPALIMQPITVPVLSHFSIRGGNALGLSPADGPLILMNLAIMWSVPADDEKIIAAATSVVDQSVAVAKEMGLDHRYIYQNYASLNQDVFAGYGEANRERLVRIAREYDPEGVFERLQPGYFKLNWMNGGSEG